MNTNDIAIKVTKLNKSFKLPHEKRSSIKSIFLHGIGNSRTFETQKVLRDISFEIKRGEFIGIVGRNGSGKSTLLKILGEIYEPTSGKVTVNGTLTPFIELGIGFNPELTGRENVFLNGAILGLTRKEIIRKYDEIVEFAELEKYMDKKLKNYSSGMQVRLAFSISLQAHNDILLIDEVLAVGDAAFQRKCFQTFRDIKKSGKTVVFVTHSMQNVTDFCDRAILIHDSRIVIEGSPEDVATEYMKLNNVGEKTKTETNTKSKRWGNKKAEIINVSCEKITDKIEITANCIFNQEIDNPVFGFSINDPINRKIVEANSLWNKLNTGTFKKGQKITLKWIVEDIFTNGSHEVTVAISDRSATEFYDWWDGAATFTINKSMITSAFALPRQEIKMENIK